MADELKVRGTVVHDASVTRDPIAPRVTRLYADRRREHLRSLFLGRRVDLETASARLPSFAGGACPATSQRLTRFAAPNALRRARRASPRRTRVRHEEKYPSRRASSSPDRLSRFFRLPIEKLDSGAPSPPVGTRRPSSTSRRRPRWTPPTTSSTATGAPRTPAWATSRARWRMPRRPSPTSRTGPRDTRARAPRSLASAGFNDAVEAYEAGLAIDPTSDVLKSGLEDVKAAKQEPSAPVGGGGAAGEDRWATSRRCSRRPT